MPIPDCCMWDPRGHVVDKMPDGREAPRRTEPPCCRRASPSRRVPTWPVVVGRPLGSRSRRDHHSLSGRHYLVGSCRPEPHRGAGRWDSDCPRGGDSPTGVPQGIHRVKARVRRKDLTGYSLERSDRIPGAEHPGATRVLRGRRNSVTFDRVIRGPRGAPRGVAGVCPKCVRAGGETRRKRRWTQAERKGKPAQGGKLRRIGGVPGTPASTFNG